MRILKSLGLIAGLLAGSAASATTITNVGDSYQLKFGVPTISTLPAGGTLASAGFQRFEALSVFVNFDRSIMDANSTQGANGIDRYSDTTGSITLVGATSGASIDLSDVGGGGVEFRVDTSSKLQIGTSDTSGTFVSLGSGISIFGAYTSDSIDELIAILAGAEVDSATGFVVRNQSGVDAFASGALTPIPLPAGGVLLIAGLGALALRKRKS